MSFLSPSKLSATAKIALFESSPRSRRRKLSAGGGSGGAGRGGEGNLPLVNSAPPSDSPDIQQQNQNQENNSNNGTHRGFLSPIRHHPGRGTNSNRRKKKELAPTASSPCVVTKLQKQVKDLEGRIHELGSGGTKTQYHILDDVAEEEERGEVDEERDDGNNESITPRKKKNGRKSSELRKLQTKLRNIQEGLILIELERLSLKEKSSRLQEEKKALEEELGNREREIATLTRRCLSQADRLQEVSKLRSTNQELAVKVQQLKVDSADEMDAIRSELQRCRAERDQVARRLESVQDDHDEVKRNFESCLTTFEKLMQEKQRWDAERQRLINASRNTEITELEDSRLVLHHHNDTTEIELEDLRREQHRHNNAKMELEDQLRLRDERIQHLEEQSLRQQKDSAFELEEAIKNRNEKIRQLEKSIQEKSKDNHHLNDNMELKDLLRLRDQRIKILEEQSLRQEKDSVSKLEEAIGARDEKIRQLEESIQSKSNDDHHNDTMELKEQLRLRDERIQLLEEQSLKHQKVSVSVSELEEAEEAIRTRDEKIRQLEKCIQEKSNDDHHNEDMELKEQLRLSGFQLVEEQSSERQQKDSVSVSELEEAIKTRDEKIRQLEKCIQEKSNDDHHNEDMELKEQLRLSGFQLVEEQSAEQQQKDSVSVSELEEAIKTRDEKIRQLEKTIQKKSDCNNNLQSQMLDMDKRHRLDRVNENRQYIFEITTRDEEIRQLEISLQETNNNNNKLQRQVFEMDRKSRLDRVNENRQYIMELESLQDEYAEHLAVLRMELHDKDAMIAVLKDEIADTFGKLMVTTQALEKAEEDSSMYQTLMEDVSTLEQERVALLEAEHEKDTEIAELSAEILKLEIEKEFIAQESNTNVESLDQSNRKLKEANKTIRQLRAQSSAKAKLNAKRYNQLIESLNAHHRTSEEKVHHLEDKLLQQQQQQLHIHESNTGKDEQSAVIHCLREFDLPDLEEKAAAAITEASRLKLELKAKELELAHTIKTYESKTHEYQLYPASEEGATGEREVQHTEHSHRLQEELNAAVSQLDSQKQQLASLDKSLQEKTGHLNEVVSQNKNLNSKLEENALHIARLMERNQSLQQQLADQEDNLERFQEAQKTSIEQKRGIKIIHSISPQEACTDLMGKENAGSKPNVVTPFKLPWRSPGA